MRPESYWFQECGTVATISKGQDRYGVVVRFDKVNYAGVATNNFSMDELVAVSSGPAAKAKAAPVASGDAANKAKAISENKNNFSVVNLFEPAPVYRYESSGAISIDMQEDYWSAILSQAEAGLT